MKQPHSFAITLILSACAAFTAEAAWGSPVLFRTEKIPCSLSIDGSNVGNIVGPDFFVRVDVRPGEHIVQCSQTISFPVGNSKMVAVPYSIYTTIAVQSGADQIIANLPSPLIRLEDLAHALGSGSFQARITSTSGFDVRSSDCSSNSYAQRIDYLNRLVPQLVENATKVAINANDDAGVPEVCDPHNRNNRNGDSVICKAAKRDAADMVRDAIAKEDQAVADLDEAGESNRRFYDRLGTSYVSVFPATRKMCGNVNFVLFQIDGQSFITTPQFSLVSNQGGTFEEK